MNSSGTVLGVVFWRKVNEGVKTSKQRGRQTHSVVKTGVYVCSTIMYIYLLGGLISIGPFQWV